METSENTICPRCHHPFECRKDKVEDCACSKMEISPVLKGWMQLRYAACLCTDCLAQLRDNPDLMKKE